MKKVGMLSILIFGLFFYISSPSNSNQKKNNGTDQVHTGERSTVLSEITLASKTKTTNKLGSKNVLMQDPLYAKNWGLEKIKTAKSWKAHKKGSKEIVVAVIDTGIDTLHVDLKDNLWVNKGETGKDKKGRDKRTNGIDDDNNGHIDDVHGWNQGRKSGFVEDNHGHGTHISGIIAAKDNHIGLTGVANNVKIMTLKYFDTGADTSKTLEYTIKSIHYAIENGAHIINYSGGGLEFSHAEKQAIKKAEAKGILFVAAAGNERSNSDLSPYYPANYKLTNIISVTATDNTKSENVLPSSNHGKNSVQIAAPGKDIFSTLPRTKGSYGKMTGTSQATAFVTGVAAQIMSHNPDWDYKLVKNTILNTGNIMTSLEGKTSTARRLNAYRALSIASQETAVTGVIAKNQNGLEAFTVDSTTQTITKNNSNVLKKTGSNVLNFLKKQQPASLD